MAGKDHIAVRTYSVQRLQWDHKSYVPLLAVLAASLLCLVNDAAGKGIRDPSPTDEYLASFFQPSSYEEHHQDTTPDPYPGAKAALQCDCDHAPSEAADGGVNLDDVHAKVVGLESRVAEMERSNNKLKKLALAAMSVALADEGEACEEAGHLGVQNLIKGFPALTLSPPVQPTSGLCDQLGTPAAPASSCRHLKLACNRPSGMYFINNGYFTKVYCEMELFGGGWARYGKGGMQSQWNFVDEDMIEVNLEIIDPRDIKEMIDMTYNTFQVHTDVRFSLQADDSTNPSRVNARILPWFHRAAYFIEGYGENFTRLEFIAGGNRITCRITPGTSHKCGYGRVPKPNEESDQILIESVYFGPRATASGANVYREDWQANRFTWQGSYYYVYAM
ncbi:echinolectin 1-like [Diadema setosum]|uniref:echinolectin 1-like n=1 Tax=Diadema setosum TaxID=31175 RepID=UPI003B3BE82E